MSFLPLNEQNTQAPAGQTTNAPAAGMPPPQSGGSAGAGQAGAGQQGSSTGSSTQFGSSASKLGDYLSANAPQIQGQADKVTSGLNQQYGQVSGDITNAANQFGQQVQGGYAAPNQSVVSQAMANPTGFASDPNNVKAFQGQYNDAYNGPANYEGSSPYSNIQGEVNKAVTGAGLLNSQAGLQSYLAGTQGGNQTQASNTLDALLLQGNPQAQQQIQGAAKQFQNLTPQLANSVTAQDQGVQAAQQAAQQAQQYAQGQFNPFVQQFGNTVNQGAQTAEAGRTNYNNALNNFYSQATPIEQQINTWAGGLPGGAGNIQDLIAPVIAANNKAGITNPITAANYATPEQYAEAAALQQLGGQGTNVPLNQADIAQAGTAPKVGTPPPAMNDILGQYSPLISQYMTNAITNPANASVGDVNKNADIAQTSDLMKYLSGIDPANYGWQPDAGAPGGGDFNFNFPTPSPQ